MRKLLIAILGVAALAIPFFILYNTNNAKSGLKLPEKKPIKEDVFINERSAIGTKENPEARKEYWFNLQKNPQTGAIPYDIRSKELAFANTLPKKSSDPRLRGKQEEWLSLGPYNVGGRTRAAVIDISNENIIIAGGVSGGVWKTTNGGEDWTSVTSPESIHSVTTISQDTRPGKTNIWYYGSGEIIGNSARAPFAPFRGDGIFKSTDNGDTWIQLPSTAQGEITEFNSQFQYVWRIVTNPFNNTGDEVLAAIFGAIVRSVDGGDSWEFVLGEEIEINDETNLNLSTLAEFTDLAITTDGTFYATLSESALNGSNENNGIFRSVDGINWTEITPAVFPSRFDRIVIGPSPSDPNTIYFLGDSDAGDFMLRYTYLSGNGAGFGGRWENLSENIPDFDGELGEYDDQDSYNMMIKVHPGNSNTVYVGATNLYRSSDGFNSTSNSAWIGGYDTANDFTIFPNHYVDQHDLVFYHSDPDKMLSLNDGGVFLTNTNRSDDINWQPLNNGFITSQAYTIGFDESTSNGLVLSGMQDNGTQISTNPDDNTRWTRFLGGDGGYCTVTKGEEYVYASFQNGQTYRFTINNSLEKTSFARVDPVGGGESADQEYLFVNPFALDPNNNNIMYLAGGDQVWRNYNLTQIPSGSQNRTNINWDQIPGTNVEDAQISAISASTIPGKIIYYGTSDGRLFRIDDALSPIPEVEEITSPDFPENGYLISIAIDRSNADHLVVAFSNYGVQSIFRSTDGGQTFEQISGNLEEFEDGSGNGPSVRWVDIFPHSDGSYTYFAATSTGLYSTISLLGENTVWIQEGANRIGNVVSVMVKHRPVDGSVIIATHGHGIFEAFFENPWNMERDMEPMLSIGSAYPNPFTTRTTIPFQITAEGPVKINIYNLSGQFVKNILFSYNYAGENFVTWDGTNEAGVPVNSGIYLCQMEFGNQTLGTKLIYNR